MPRNRKLAQNPNSVSKIDHQLFAAQAQLAPILELVPVANLTPSPKNPRTHCRQQLRQIARNIEKFGFMVPALIDEDNYTLAGHGRSEQSYANLAVFNHDGSIQFIWIDVLFRHQIHDLVLGLIAAAPPRQILPQQTRRAALLQSHGLTVQCIGFGRPSPPTVRSASSISFRLK